MKPELAASGIGQGRRGDGEFHRRGELGGGEAEEGERGVGNRLDEIRAMANARGVQLLLATWPGEAAAWLCERKQRARAAARRQASASPAPGDEQ